MKITVTKETETIELPFPKLMVTESGTVVMFKRPRVGTVVCAGRCVSDILAVSADYWNMHHFTDFHGRITLENGE